MASYFGLPDEKMNIVYVLTFGRVNQDLQITEDLQTTGFAVTEHGHILTTAHLLNRRHVEYGIMARRLDQSDISTTHVVKICPEWNLAMLKISKTTPYGEFSSGNLVAQQPLLYIGNPDFDIGSSLFGRVSFPCVDNPTMPTNETTCESYESTERQTTPRYKVLGHVYNSGYFLRNECNYLDDSSKKFHKKLNPLIPIVQTHGFFPEHSLRNSFGEHGLRNSFGGGGFEGGPMFDTNGQIVGMMFANERGFQLGIHVSLLKHFMQLCLSD